MELHELTNIWNGTDNKMESSLRINKVLFMEVSINQIKSDLKSLRWTSYFEIIINVMFLSFILNFSISQFSEIKFLIPALLLIAFTFYSMFFSVKKLSLHYGINAQTPVMVTQKKLEKLKLMEIRERQMLYILIPMLSPTFLIVGAKAFLGFDLYHYMNWLIAQTAASVVIAIIIVFILNKFPDKKLQQTISFLNEIAESEKE